MHSQGLDKLHLVRQAFNECSRLDGLLDHHLEATLDRLENTLSKRILKVHHHPAEAVSALSAAAGLLLYAESSSIGASRLAGLRTTVFNHVRGMSETDANSSVKPSLGVLVSILLPASIPHIAALPFQDCIASALTACLLHQFVPSPMASIPPILLYSTNVAAAFTSCILEAETPDHLCSLMRPLIAMASSICVPHPTQPSLVPAEVSRPILQRSIAPIVLQILQRLDQISPAQPNSAATTSLFSFKPWQALSRFWQSSTQSPEASCATLHPATNLAAADAAHLMALAYHEESRAQAPQLSACISYVLRSLSCDRNAAMLLAQRVPRPSMLYQGPRSPLNSPVLPVSQGPQHPLHQEGSCVGVMNPRDVADFVARTRARMEESLIPSVHSRGHWQDAACFMLTLVQATLPQDRVELENGDLGEEQQGWWNCLLDELLVPAEALMLSCDSHRKCATEVILAALAGAPDICYGKQQMCMTAVTLHFLQTGDGLIGIELTTIMQGVAMFARPQDVLLTCRLCCFLVEGCQDEDSVGHVASSLMLVVVHGNISLLCEVLRMLDHLLYSQVSAAFLTRILVNIRRTLENCHDVRKKPQCVRWYHDHLLKFKML